MRNVSVGNAISLRTFFKNLPLRFDRLYIQAKVENKINQNKIYIFKLRGILGRGPLRPPPPRIPPSLDN